MFRTIKILKHHAIPDSGNLNLKICVSQAQKNWSKITHVCNTAILKFQKFVERFQFIF